VSIRIGQYFGVGGRNNYSGQSEHGGEASARAIPITPSNTL